MSGMILPNLIAVRQGDSFDVVLKFVNEQGQKIDLTDSVFEMQVREIDSDNIIFKKSGEVTVSEAMASFALTPAETKYDPADYKVDIQWTDKDGRVNTIFPMDVNKTGIFRITEQVTK